ncbi:hypothetical protein ACIRPP_30235 [Streptomyces sp. NPDC101219]|uniref:hypothetical protein n=1 Tax=Streptomyces sp. NPDC101219 TaxID=3366131 RepID=UPI00382AC60D
MPMSSGRGPTGTTAVTLTAANLADTTAVRFAGTSAAVLRRVLVTGPGAVAPPGAGAVEVTVTAPRGVSTAVPLFLLTGANGAGTGRRVCGGAPAPCAVAGSAALSVVDPPGAAGAGGVAVTDPAGTATVQDAFTCVTAPGI